MQTDPEEHNNAKEPSREPAPKKLPSGDEEPELDPVDEASEESFPASDPPARTPITRP